MKPKVMAYISFHVDNKNAARVDLLFLISSEDKGMPIISVFDSLKNKEVLVDPGQ